MAKLPFEELKEIIIAGAKVGTAFGSIAEDGKFKTIELTKFIPHLDDIVAAGRGFKAGINHIDDLTEAEVVALKEIIAREFDLKDDVQEDLIEDLLFASLAMGLSIARFIDYQKAKKQNQ